MKRIISSSIITGVLALALITTATPTQPLYAATRAELEATIASLLAQVQQLQALLEARQSATPSINLTRNLSLGMTGSDVKALQQFLNTDPATTVALSGIGSKGNETTYFGPATQAAVIKFQNKYRSEVLSPAGLVNGTGYVGPSTRAKINQLATQHTQTQTQSQTQTQTQSQTQTNDNDQQTEATISEEGDIVVTRGSEHTSTLELTGDYDEIYSVQIKAEDSAMTINRMEFMFDKKPWRYIDTFVLYHEGEEVAKVRVSEKTITEVGDEYRLRFTGLSEVVAKGDKDTFILEAKALDSISSKYVGDTLSVYLPEKGIRALDTAKLSTQEPSTDLSTRTFDFRDAEGDGELTVTLNSDSPDGGIMEVNENSNTTNRTVLIANLAAKDSDITLKEVYVKVESSESTVTNVVRNLSLVFDDKIIAKESVMKNTGNAITGKDEDGNSYTIIDTGEYYVHFEDLEEIVIDDDTRDTLTFKAEFYKQSGKYDNGTEVIFTLRAAEGENVHGEDIVNGNITTGSNQTHFLYTEGLSFEFVREDAGTTGQYDRTGSFTLTFDATAFGEDIYVKKGADRQTGTTTIGDIGVEYSITNSNGELYTLGGEAQLLDIKNAKNSDGYFKLTKGSTYRVTLKVTLDNAGAVSDFYRTELEAFRFKVGSTSGTEHTITDGFNNYRTGYVSVNS